MLSLTHQFLSWCRSKPADDEYRIGNTRTCALGQFGVIGGLRACERQGIPPSVYAAAVYEYPHTFGALAERVERQLVEQVTL